MKIAVDLDDTLSMVDRARGAGAYIARNGLPFRLKDADAPKLAEVYDWTEEDALAFVRDGGIALFTDAKARKGAREALAGWRTAGHGVVVLTARMKEWFVNPEPVSRDWLEKRRIPFDEVVSDVPAAEKGKYCARSGISVLVDDNAEACLSAQRCGVYAVLALRKYNLARAKEIAFGGGNWAGIDAAVRRIAEISALEEEFYRSCLSRRRESYEGWELRFDDCEDRRCNHIRPVAPSFLSAEEKLMLCEMCYRTEGKACRFRLTDLDGALDAVLTACGYREEARGECLILRNVPVLSYPAGIEINDLARWKEAFRSVTGEEKLRPLRRIEGRSTFLSVCEEGRPVAVGMVTVEGASAWIGDLRVRADRRGMGYGKKLTAGLLAACGKAGAARVCVQVASEDTAARSLFRLFGFGKAYGYAYKTLDAVDGVF